MKLLLTLLTVAMMTASTFAAAGDAPFTNLRPQINADGSYERPQDMTAKMVRALADLYGLATTNGIKFNISGTNISVEVTNATFTASITNDVNLNPTNSVIVSSITGDVNLNPTNAITVSNDVNLNPTNSVIVSSITADVNLSPTNTVIISNDVNLNPTNTIIVSNDVNLSPTNIIGITGNVTLDPTNTIIISGDVNLNPTNTIIASLSDTNVGAVIIGTASVTNLAPTLAASTAYGSNLVVKGSAGVLYSLAGYSSLATGQFIHVYDRTDAPTNGAVPVFVWRVDMTNNFSVPIPVGGIPLAAGIVVANSTDGPTQTNGAADVFFTATYK